MAVGDDQALEAGIAPRSSVKIEQTSKGPVQIKVSVYAGDDADVMQAVKDLAIDTYQKTIAELKTRGIVTTSG